MKNEEQTTDPAIPCTRWKQPGAGTNEAKVTTSARKLIQPHFLKATPGGRPRDQPPDATQ